MDNLQEQKIRTQIIKDAKFSNLEFENSSEINLIWKIKITKVTAKRAYIDIMEAKYSRKYNIDTKKFDNGITFCYKSGYIVIEELVHILLYKISNATKRFFGINHISYKFIKTDQLLTDFIKQNDQND